MAVVPLVADVVADVVQQRGVLEPLALAVAEPVHAAQTVEQRQRQPRHLLRVLRLPAAAFGQFERRAAAHVGNLVDLADVLAVALDEVEHQAFAQRQIAQRDVLGVERAQQRVEQHGAGHDQVGAARVERRDLQAPFERQVADQLADLADRLGRHAQVAHLGRRRAGVERGGDRAEREDRARRADDAVVAGVDDVAEIAIDLAADVLEHLALVAAAERVGRDEALRQADARRA